jgi:hypothetical protein
MKVNPMFLQEGMHLYPAFKAKHLSNLGLRKPLCAITFQRQRLKRDT